MKNSLILDHGKIIEGTKGSPDGRMASMQIAAFGLLADIMTSKTLPAASGTIPCDMMTSFALLPASWHNWTWNSPHPCH